MKGRMKPGAKQTSESRVLVKEDSGKWALGGRINRTVRSQVMLGWGGDRLG